MAERLIRDITTLDEVVSYFSKNTFLKHFKNTKDNTKILILLSIIVFMFSPLLAITLLLFTIPYFYKEVAFKLLRTRQVMLKYKNMYAPKLDKESMSILGYRVEAEELEEHISILPDNKKLAEKQKAMLNNKKRYVGIGPDTLRTHMIVVGMTGSGKTEFARSLNNDVWKYGGGSIINDGKADSKMLSEVGTQLKKLGRETSLRVINYLKPDKMAETNTLNPLTIMTPQRAVEFLMNLNDSGSENADPTHLYFQQRGKAVITPPITALTIRKKYFKESFNFERIRSATAIPNMIIIYMLFYGMCRELNDQIQANDIIRKMISGFAVTGVQEEFKYISKLIEYIIQNPLNKNKVENLIGIDFMDIVQMYLYVKEGIGLYLKEVWSGYDMYLDLVADFVYKVIKADENNYFFKIENKEMQGLNYDTFLKIYLEIKEAVRNNEHKKWQMETGYPEWKLKKVHEAWSREKAKGGNIEELPDDAVQQHQYAVQQWTNLFNVFTIFRHIFGQTNSEINPKDLLLDNQILYNLMPVSELGKANTEIIGKISLALIDEVASIALMGEKISLHITLKRILKDRNTPKPLYVTFLDEYNSYPISGVDIKLLQYRSLNIPIIIGIQNLAGLKVGGQSETSKENALANATKYFLKTEDEKVVEWLNRMIAEEEVLESDFIRDWDDTRLIKSDTGLKITKKRLFDAQLLSNFQKGFGLIFKGSRVDDLVFMQTFYRGGEETTIKLHHFIPLD